jgi:hypothetical protein
MTARRLVEHLTRKIRTRPPQEFPQHLQEARDPDYVCCDNHESPYADDVGQEGYRPWTKGKQDDEI